MGKIELGKYFHKRSMEGESEPWESEIRRISAENLKTKHRLFEEKNFFKRYKKQQILIDEKQIDF